MPTMELPVVCTYCHQESMVDVENLDSQKTSFGHLEIAKGYTCPHCGKWVLVFLTTRALDEKMNQLQRTPPDHPSFWYRFVKAFKRSKELQERSL